MVDGYDRAAKVRLAIIGEFIYSRWHRAHPARRRRKAFGLDRINAGRSENVPGYGQDEIGTALSAAQFGRKAASAKPWHGEGPGVFEIVEDFQTDTYRAVYTVRFASAVYVLHAFQKKSPHGLKTDRRDVALIQRRLAAARQHHQQHYG